MVLASRFFTTMIVVKTRYKVYNNKLLTIEKNLKNYQHSVKDCQYKILVFINYQNLC